MTALNLTLFDRFPPDQVAALPPKLRGVVVADRKRRVTAVLAASHRTS